MHVLDLFYLPFYGLCVIKVRFSGIEFYPLQAGKIPCLKYWQTGAANVRWDSLIVQYSYKDTCDLTGNDFLF